MSDETDDLLFDALEVVIPEPQVAEREVGALAMDDDSEALLSSPAVYTP